MDSKVRSLTDYRPKATSQNQQPALGISPPAGAQKPRLLDQVRLAIRARHYSPRTEETYVGWIKRFIFYHNKRHPFPLQPGKRISRQRINAKPGIECHLVPLP